MRIAEINIVANGSTGRIMLHIARVARDCGYEVKTFSPVLFARGAKKIQSQIPEHFSWGGVGESFFHYYAGTLLGKNGLLSKKGTAQLINELKAFNPDIIHLHNIHRYCLNLPMLFDYIKTSGAKVVWTLHDCWSFTGNCAHFVSSGCEKWKEGCYSCPQPRSYPKMYVDTSKKMYELKKKLFCGVKDMTLVTPSRWLCELTEQSFLREYPARVINNGIDLSVFKPTDGNFREKHGLLNKKIILGVAFRWSYEKGLDVMTELSKRLPDDYKIVLVGTNESVDASLPENILSIHKTENQRELAEIYTAADLFVNATREDTYPTVNMEALACGTPVLTFDIGGSAEIIDDSCGCAVKVNDVDGMEREIVRICTEKPYSAEACLERARSFDMHDRFKEYVELYKEVTDR